MGTRLLICDLLRSLQGGVGVGPRRAEPRAQGLFLWLCEHLHGLGGLVPQAPSVALLELVSRPARKVFAFSPARN